MADDHHSGNVGKPLSTSTRCNTLSPPHRVKKGSSKCGSTSSAALPNFSPITSGNSSLRTEQDSARYPLSSLNSSFNDHDVCRICHGGNSAELLLSPCYCAGSMGKIHLTCLQRWLGSSNKTRCEICDFQFTLERKTKPFKQFLSNPGSPRDKRNMVCDMVCFSLLTPTTIGTAWLCMQNALHIHLDKWESGSIFSLAICLLVLYSAWVAVCLRHNYNVWKDWSQFNQDVKLKCQPPPTARSPDSKGHVQLTSVEIPLCKRQQHPLSRDAVPSAKDASGTHTRAPMSPVQSYHSNDPKGVRSERSSTHTRTSRSPVQSYHSNDPKGIRSERSGTRSSVKSYISNDPDWIMKERSSYHARSPVQSYHSNDPNGVRNERSKSPCFSPRSGHSSRSCQPPLSQNLVANQDISPTFRTEYSTAYLDPRVMSPAYCNHGNDSDGGRLRNQFFNPMVSNGTMPRQSGPVPRVKCNAPYSQRSVTPSDLSDDQNVFSEESLRSQNIMPKSLVHEQLEKIPRIRSTTSSGQRSLSPNYTLYTSSNQASSSLSSHAGLTDTPPVWCAMAHDTSIISQGQPHSNSGERPLCPDSKSESLSLVQQGQIGAAATRDRTELNNDDPDNLKYPRDGVQETYI